MLRPAEERVGVCAVEPAAEEVCAGDEPDAEDAADTAAERCLAERIAGFEGAI
jgi:hypothetical protein